VVRKNANKDVQTHAFDIRMICGPVYAVCAPKSHLIAVHIFANKVATIWVA